MYESQEQISTRDAFELGLIAAAIQMADDDADAAELAMAINDGFDPFQGLTIAEFYAMLDNLVTA